MEWEKNLLDSPPVTVDQGHQSISRKILELNWNDYFPIQLIEEASSSFSGTKIEVSNLETFMEFNRKHYQEINQTETLPSPFLKEDMTAQKLRYYREFGDFFAFKQR